MPSLDSSIPTESDSDTESSLSDSDGWEQSRPGSPDVVFLGNAEDDTSEEEETISLSGCSKSDTEEVHATAACEKARLGDVLYATWHDNQIHKGNDVIRQCDSRVHDHPLFGKRCEAPDQVGPPISYMEERGVFKPAESINNPMGSVSFTRRVPGKPMYWLGPIQPSLLVGFTTLLR